MATGRRRERAMNLDLFTRLRRPSILDVLDERDDGLRYYQESAVEAAFRELETRRSTMLIMATGVGKSRVASAFVRRWLEQFGGRVLWLAHRDELVLQARDTLREICDEPVGIEQAEQFSGKERIVVGSVQTVYSDKRMESLQHRGGFTLLVVDELHCFVAKRYRAPLAFFANAKVLGLTATPDRADGKALGQIIDSEAFRFDIVDAIDAGYLVPFVDPQEVFIESIDISQVKTSRGEGGFDLGELDEAMVKGAEGIAKETLARTSGRQGLIFTPGIKTAHYVAEAMNREKPGCCVAVDGSTEKAIRRSILKDYRAGRIQYIANCAVFTTGTDLPTCSAVIVARPCKSRALWAQMMGRGGRVLPGVVDHIGGEGGAEARRAAIEASAKSNCVIIDMVGNPGKHGVSLVGPLDALGGNYTPKEIKRAKEKLKEQKGVSATEALKAARREIKALAQVTKSKVKATSKAFNPFEVFRVNTWQENEHMAKFGFEPPTEPMAEFLLRKGVSPEELKQMSKFAAGKLIAKLKERQAKGLSTLKQTRLLERNGFHKPNATFERANEALNVIFDACKRREKVDVDRVERILNARREAG